MMYKLIRLFQMPSMPPHLNLDFTHLSSQPISLGPSCSNKALELQHHRVLGRNWQFCAQNEMKLSLFVAKCSPNSHSCHQAHLWPGAPSWAQSQWPWSGCRSARTAKSPPWSIRVVLGTIPQQQRGSDPYRHHFVVPVFLFQGPIYLHTTRIS